MVTAYAKMTRKGQITVPAAVRQALGLSEGDRIEIELTGGAVPQAALRRAGSVVDSTRGALSTAESRSVGLSEMRESFAEHMASRADNRENLPPTQ